MVSGINMIKKHTKPNPQAGRSRWDCREGGPIQVSNVANFNPSTQRQTVWAIVEAMARKFESSNPAAK